MSPPDPPQQQPDPFLQQQQKQAQLDQIDALQAKTQGDTAALVARYGVMQALGGSSSASLAKLG